MKKKYERQSGNLIRIILIPISIALFFLLLIGIYFYLQQQQINLEQFVEKQVSLFSTELHHEIEHKKGILAAVHFLGYS